MNMLSSPSGELGVMVAFVTTSRPGERIRSTFRARSEPLSLTEMLWNLVVFGRGKEVCTNGGGREGWGVANTELVGF